MRRGLLTDNHSWACAHLWVATKHHLIRIPQNIRAKDHSAQATAQEQRHTLGARVFIGIGIREMPVHSSRKRWIVVALAVSLALGFAALCVPAPPRGAVPGVAWACAMISLFWSLMTLGAEWGRRGLGAGLNGGTTDVARAVRGAALLFGVAAAVIQSVLLVMRSIYFGIDALHGYPWRGMRSFGFDAGGLWTLCALSVSCAAALAAVRDSRLATCQFWLLVMLAAWACLLADPYRATVTGGFERTDATLLLTATLAGMLTAWVVVTQWLSRAGYFADRRTGPDSAARLSDSPSGFRASVSTLGTALTLAACYHLLVPVGASSGGVRVSAGVACVASAVAAVGCFMLLRRSWGDMLADAALGLSSMALCGAAILFIPTERAALADQYPMIFSAIIVGAAAATGLWTNLACKWQVSGAAESPATIRCRLVPHAKRFAFLCAAIALLAGTLMTFWPRLPGIPAMDHSLGRVAAGFGANLFFLLVTLSCSRRLGRVSFQILTVLAAVSAAGFLFMRMLPFASGLS